VVGKIDAHRLGGDLVVADGFERAAVGGVSVLTSFLYIAALEWLLRGLDTGKFLGITAPGLFKNGFRMAVISVIIMDVLLFFRKGIMGDKELPDLLRRHTKREAARNEPKRSASRQYYDAVRRRRRRRQPEP